MKKVIINEKQKGLVFENGKFSRLLSAGKYRFLKNKDVEV